MKKVVNAGIGGRNFVIEEDAYNRLDAYLNAFRSKAGDGNSSAEVMDDVEARISELFASRIYSGNEVVTLSLVNEVVSQLGMPDGSKEEHQDSSAPDSASDNGTQADKAGKPKKKFYRDSDEKFLGGVCGGLAQYFNVDVMLLRIIFLVLLIAGGTGFWAYLILWLVAPLAKTSAQKCELHGLPVTAENMAKYPSSK